MNGFIDNIEKKTAENKNFRKVLYTGRHSQLVVMSLKPGEEIGEETHQLDQFLRIESESGKAVLEGKETAVANGSAIVVPSGTKHNIINTSFEKPMKLYTVYSLPNHRDGTVHVTKSEAEKNEEHFDGQTTE